jgi:hypothetical protein
MKTHRLHSLIAIIVLLCFLAAAWSAPAEAQKKTKPKTQTKTQVKDTSKDQPEKTQKEEQAEVAPTPATPPAPGTLPNKFLDVLKQYVGKKTNLGILKKFAGDYIVFEDELTTILVPVTSIQSAKLIKEEESSPAELEIKLIARD